MGDEHWQRGVSVRVLNRKGGELGRALRGHGHTGHPTRRSIPDDEDGGLLESRRDDIRSWFDYRLQLADAAPSRVLKKNRQRRYRPVVVLTYPGDAPHANRPPTLLDNRFKQPTRSTALFAGAERNGSAAEAT